MILKRSKHAVMTVLVLSLGILLFGPQSADAATGIKGLMDKAASTGTVLKWAISIEGSGDGKTRPWGPYNDAKKANTNALAAINKLPAAQRATYLETLEKTSGIHITRAMYYIDAITAGEKINEKKAALQQKIDAGVMNDETEQAYHDLSFEIRKQGILLDRVYGQSTRDLIRGNYKHSAEEVRNSILYAITVKMNLDKAEELLAVSPTDPEIKRLVDESAPLFTLITNEQFNQQLRERYTTISTKIGGVVTPPVQKVELTIPEIKATLTAEAIKRNIPPEVLKSVALQENGSLRQFNADGTPLISWDGGIGIMQVTNPGPGIDVERLKYDTIYNIQVGADILLSKWRYGGSRTPTVNNNDPRIIENWYFAIMAYNGLSTRNDPTVPTNSPYQVKVYAKMDQYAGVEAEVIKSTDIAVTNVSGILYFNGKMNYTTTKQTTSTQTFNIGDQIVTSANSNFRIEPRTGVKYTILPAGSSVTILSEPIQDDNYLNLFSWYKVRDNNTGQEGYLASLNLQ
ncbi:hypothetical protein ACLM5H_11355 [Fredinandcohnia humi]